MKQAYLFTLLIALVAGAAGGWMVAPAGTASTQEESVFDRVLRTGTIRCGYYVYPPMTQRDSNTNEMSGIAVDLMKRLGDSLSLKVEWAEEVTFGNMFAGLDAGRYDALCTPTWPSSAAGRVSLFSRPLFYTAVMAYVRSDDTRFDNSTLASFDDSSVRLAVEEGDPVASAVAVQLPKATLVTLPVDAVAGAVELEVITGKADVTFIDRNRARHFMLSNPGALKEVGGGQPLQVYPFRLAVPQNEHSLNALFDTALEEAQNDGFMARLIDKHDPDHLFLRVSPPYLK